MLTKYCYLAFSGSPITCMWLSGLLWVLNSAAELILIFSVLKHLLMIA